MIESTLPTMPTVQTWPTMRRPVLPGISHHASAQPDRISPWLFAVPVVVFILRFLPTPVSDAAYGITAIYALTGRRQAVVAIVMLCFLNLATHAFVMPPGFATIYRFVIIAAAFFSTIVLHGGGALKTRCPLLLAGTAILCGLITLHSATLSQIPALSVLKSLSFSMTILAVIAGWAGLSASDRRAAEVQVWGLVAGLTVLSTPMLATPLGYLRSFGGFQGLTCHAQPFGAFMGVFAAFLWVSVITRRRLSIAYILLACLATAFIYLSRARIGGVTLAIGLFAGIAISPLFALLDRWRTQPRLRFGRLVMAGVVVGAALLFSGDVIYRTIGDFLVKYGTAQEGVNFSDALYSARGRVVELMLQSVAEHPLTGIGFGVPTKGGLSTDIVYDRIFNLPIMATAEKGVMVLAILEELGYPLATLVYLWLAWLFFRAGRGGPVALALFSAALAVNIAESCFFSPGGAGTFILTIVGMAVTASYYAPSPEKRSGVRQPFLQGSPWPPVAEASRRTHDGLIPHLLAGS